MNEREKAIQTLKMLAVDAVEAAKSGHPGSPMGQAEIAYVIWTRYLRHWPADPAWPGRDRFVLSAGHGSMLIYALLHLTGYASPTMDDIRNFRQLGSPCAGHPENFLIDGVEATTGPLGQGLAMAVGMAIAERYLNAKFGNELVDRTLGYLALKPIARWRIVLPKLAAAFVVGGIPVAVSGFLAVALVGGGGAVKGALATAAGLLVGAAAYAALFTWAGLATRHALLIGLVYVFVWEATLAAYLDGVRFLSIRRYTLAMIHGLDNARLATIENPLSAGAAAVAAAIVVVGFTALAVRKLARMDVP